MMARMTAARNALAFLALFPAAAIGFAQTCGSALPEFTETTLPSCEQALCADAGPLGAKVCACLKNAEEGEVEITVTDSAQRIRTFRTEVQSPAFGPYSVRLLSAPPHVLLAVMNSWSNGQGIEDWSLWVLGRDAISRPLQVNDFGAMSFLVPARQGSGCNVFGARWRRRSSACVRRGRGL